MISDDLKQFHFFILTVFAYFFSFVKTWTKITGFVAGTIPPFRPALF